MGRRSSHAWADGQRSYGGVDRLLRIAHLDRTLITAGSSSSVTLMVTCMLSMAPDGSVAVTNTV